MMVSTGPSKYKKNIYQQFPRGSLLTRCKISSNHLYRDQMKSVGKKIVYTAMHGVGFEFVKKLMQRLGVTNFGVTTQ